MPAVAFTPAQFATAAERLPSTPQVYARLNAAMKDPDVGLEEIVSMVRMDASLSARLLRLSNSPMFGRGEPVSTLNDAINRTGLDEIYRLVGAAMASQLYVTGLPIYGVGGDELCINSLATAVAMEHLCEHTGENPRLGYTLGLLRSVGRLLLQRLAAQALCPPLAGRKDTAAKVLEWESSTFGITHADAAEQLFNLWKFPDDLGTPLRQHYSPVSHPSPNRIGALLHLASWIASDVGGSLPIEKEVWQDSDEILAQAGVTRETLISADEATRTATATLTLMLKAA